jgi:hypothetical protein
MQRPRKIAHEKFAQFVASGLSLAESYRRTTGQTRNSDVKGTQWHGYAGIRQRIAELKTQNARRAQMTREELLVFYAEVIRTPADQVPTGSPVIQAYEMTESGPKIRICDKAAAGAQLAKMCGWNEPDQVQLNAANPFTGYILELRREPLGGPAIELAGERTGSVIELENGANGETRPVQGAGE